MKSICFEDIPKIIRPILAKASNNTVPLDKIINLNSQYGAMVENIENDGILSSIDLNDPNIFFLVETLENPNNNVSYDEDITRKIDGLFASNETIASDTTIVREPEYIEFYNVRCYQACKIKITMYGEQTDIARGIAGQLLSERIRQDLNIKGVYLQKATLYPTVHEFINNAMWVRNDIDIIIGYNNVFSVANSDYYFNKLNTITTKECEK